MNTPVDFELAKLLKEKGIKIDTDEVIFYVDEVNNIEEHQIINRNVLYNYTGLNDYTPDENEYQAYKISEVVMWLYEKHGIWITVCVIGADGFGYWLHNKNRKRLNAQDQGGYWYSPTEAYEAGIEYTLNNLI